MIVSLVWWQQENQTFIPFFSGSQNLKKKLMIKIV